METERSCIIKFAMTIIALGGAAWFYIKFRRTFFTKCVKVGYVSKIMCYPVTSCAGISEDNAWCTRLGLSMLNFTDREFLVGKALDPTAIVQYESLNLRDIQVFVNGRNLLLKYEDFENEKISVPRNKDRQGCTVQCLGMEIDAIDCGDKVGAWLNQCMEETNLRLFDCKYVWAVESKRFKSVGCLLTTESTMEEINQMFRFDPPLPVDHFRPNIIISGTKPFDERRWDSVYIGDEAALERRVSNVKLIENAYDQTNLEWRHEGMPRDAINGAICIPCSFQTTDVGFYATVFREGRIVVGDPVFVVYQPTFLSSYSS